MVVNQFIYFELLKFKRIFGVLLSNLFVKVRKFTHSATKKFTRCSMHVHVTEIRYFSSFLVAPGHAPRIHHESVIQNSHQPIRGHY